MKYGEFIFSRSVPMNESHENKSGAYFLMLGDKITYIGSSYTLGKRIKEHRYSGKQFDSVRVYITNSYTECERKCILHFKPSCNLRYKTKSAPSKTARSSEVWSTRPKPHLTQMLAAMLRAGKSKAQIVDDAFEMLYAARNKGENKRGK